jgi:glycosyltransferase involved in cell wall biosynthesis
MRIGIEGLPLLFHRTGTATYTHELVQHLRRQNPQDTVILFARNQRSGGGSYHDISYGERVANYIYKEYRLPSDLADSNIDIYHSPRDMGMPRPRQIPCANVMTLHDIILVRLASDYYSKARAKMYEQRLLSRIREVDHIITISSFSKQDIVDWSGIDPDKISVVHDGVGEKFVPVSDESVLSAVRMKYKLPHNFILCVGSTEPRKNTRAAIQAYSRLRKLRPELQMVATGAAYTGIKPHQAFSGQDLTGVLFPGYIHDDDMPALYTLADVVLYPSLYEGFGLPPLEAMACGTPAVTSSTTSLPEVVADAAIKVDPQDPDGIAAALEMLFSSKELRDELVVKGTARASEFTWSSTARQTRAIYDRVIAEHDR